MARVDDLDILKEISNPSNSSHCGKLLKRFKAANLSPHDVMGALNHLGCTPLHFALYNCKGEGLKELVEYLYNLHPEFIQKQSVSGYLPIHYMPSSSTEQVQRDQLEARLFLMQKFPEGLHQKNEDGRTPYEQAKVRKKKILAKQIEEFLANPRVAEGAKEEVIWA